MNRFEVTVTHTEESLTALAHMQYDLFCTRNFITRNILSIAAIAFGALNISRVWGIALLAYGAYLMTSTYSSSNHTVKKLVESIHASGKGFPSSRYTFTDKGIDITFHPGLEDEEPLTPVGYEELLKLGEDKEYYYLFPTPSGGYSIPKAALGERERDFAAFIEEKTGKRFYRRRPSPMQRLRDWFRAREQEPVHL